jgi:hypothetical protein
MLEVSKAYARVAYIHVEETKLYKGMIYFVHELEICEYPKTTKYRWEHFNFMHFRFHLHAPIEFYIMINFYGG